MFNFKLCSETIGLNILTGNIYAVQPSFTSFSFNIALKDVPSFLSENTEYTICSAIKSRNTIKSVHHRNFSAGNLNCGACQFYACLLGIIDGLLVGDKTPRKFDAVEHVNVIGS